MKNLQVNHREKGAIQEAEAGTFHIHKEAGSRNGFLKWKRNHRAIIYLHTTEGQIILLSPTLMYYTDMVSFHLSNRDNKITTSIAPIYLRQALNIYVISTYLNIAIELIRIRINFGVAWESKNKPHLNRAIIQSYRVKDSLNVLIFVVSFTTCKVPQSLDQHFNVLNFLLLYRANLANRHRAILNIFSLL